jgi:hypothetical protein
MKAEGSLVDLSTTAVVGLGIFVSLPSKRIIFCLLIETRYTGKMFARFFIDYSWYRELIAYIVLFAAGGT